MRAAAYYDAIAPRYDAEVTTAARDRLARRAFVDLVAREVPAGGTIVDFGCGTGLDAQVYARLGYTVLAYDSSSGMLEQLALRCAGEIQAGRVRIVPPGLAALDAATEASPPRAIVANFAVLNMVKDLGPLCEWSARVLSSDGRLIVSLLNPWHWREVATWRWWREAARFSRQSPHRHLSRHFDSYFHFETDLLDAAHDFRVCGRARAGSMVRYSPDDGSAPLVWSDPALARPVVSLAWATPMSRLLGTFVFFALRRT